MFSRKECKTRTGSERSNTNVAVDVCSRPLTHLYSALNTPCLLPWILCLQLVFIVFATRICYFVQLPKILTLVYCNRCDWCSVHCQSSSAQKKKKQLLQECVCVRLRLKGRGSGRDDHFERVYECRFSCFVSIWDRDRSILRNVVAFVALSDGQCPNYQLRLCSFGHFSSAG